MATDAQVANASIIEELQDKLHQAQADTRNGIILEATTEVQVTPTQKVKASKKAKASK